MDWKNIKIHVLDFEGSVRTGIVEYGVATLLGGRIVSAATRLCSVREPIPLEESEIHGIFDEDVEGNPPIEADWDFFLHLRKTGLLGSHHAPAEIGMLSSVWKFPGAVPDFSLESRPPTNNWGPWIDTCKIAKEWFPHERKHNLGTLIERFELPERVDADAKKFCPKARARYHCALYDAIAAAHLLINMCEHPVFEKSSILDLVRASSGAKRFQEHIQAEFDFF
ncbi:MAG: 3'-5' exonuclease [Opitutales bacterium]|nr:3'-5' exonuclease [Opitutales bacterium]